MNRPPAIRFANFASCAAGGRRAVVVLLAALLLPGCQSAYYRTMEAMGRPKRELLLRHVASARDSQAAARDRFADTLARLRAVTDGEQRELEAAYRRLGRDLARNETAARRVWDDIVALDEVAAALFEEWERELEAYHGDELRRQSADALDRTRRRYQQLITALRRGALGMEPLLDSFRDHQLFLRHNLNARAAASLRPAIANLGGEVDTLTRRMDAAIAEADRFLARREPWLP